jgi:hypothetical protein
MSKFLAPRVSRAAAALAALCVFALAPVAAQAADTNATGTLSAGGVSNTAPPITPFTATLSGVTQTVFAAVGAWSVTDATGSGGGYSVTVSSGVPSVNTTSIAGSVPSVGWVTLTPTTATAAAGNPAPASTHPVAAGPQMLSATAATIEHAAVATGSGEWDFAADSGVTKNLAVVIPGNALVGSYSDTLTFTSSPGA